MQPIKTISPALIFLFVLISKFSTLQKAIIEKISKIIPPEQEIIIK